MDDQESELRNPFPSPPSLYLNYTSRNLELLSLLQERHQGDLADADQAAELADQPDIPDWPLSSLLKPRVDWVVENGAYNSFGETWTINEHFLTIADAYGSQLYPLDPAADNRPALLSILRSLMFAYSATMKSLLRSPTILSNATRHDSDQQLQWISYLCFNMIGAVNELRPVQARLNLEALMKSQLQLRVAETEAIHKTCDALEEKLASLIASSSEVSLKNDREKVDAVSSGRGLPESNSMDLVEGVGATPSVEDVLKWADSIN